MTYRSFLNKGSIGDRVRGDRGTVRLWGAHFLPTWTPLLLGIGLGLFLAFLIANRAWPFPIVVVFLVPGIILIARYPFAAVLIWMLLFPFIVREPTTAARYGYWLLHRLMIPAALAAAILSQWRRAKQGHAPVSFRAPELAMVAFIALVIANIFVFHSSPTPKLYHLYDHLFVPFCMYWLIRLAAPGENDLKLFLWVALIIVVAQSAIGLLSWFAPHLLPRAWLDLQGQRTVGTFGNPAVFSSTLVFLSLLLLHHAMQSKPGRRRFGLLLVVSLAFFSVFFTFSRGSWLGGLAVLVGLIFVYPKQVITLTVIVSAIVFFLGSSLLDDEVSWAWERLNSSNSAEGRIIGYNASTEMIKAKPLFGWGYRNYDRYDRSFKLRVGEIPVRGESTSHNTYLTLMAETGLIAFLFYIFPLGYWLVASVQAWRWLPQTGFWSQGLLIVLWLLIIDHIIVSNFMDMIRFNQFGTTVYWMALALIANVVSPDQRSRVRAESGNAPATSDFSQRRRIPLISPWRTSG
jgi:O-antigen ligase